MGPLRSGSSLRVPASSLPAASRFILSPGGSADWVAESGALHYRALLSAQTVVGEPPTLPAFPPGVLRTPFLGPAQKSAFRQALRAPRNGPPGPQFGAPGGPQKGGPGGPKSGFSGVLGGGWGGSAHYADPTAQSA